MNSRGCVIISFCFSHNLVAVVSSSTVERSVGFSRGVERNASLPQKRTVAIGGGGGGGIVIYMYITILLIYINMYILTYLMNEIILINVQVSFAHGLWNPTQNHIWNSLNLS